MFDATPLIDQNQEDFEETKQGSKYFGCCCDSRRAVILVNTTDIVFNFTFYIAQTHYIDAITGLQIAVWIVNQIWNVATILGAVCYSDIVVLMGVMWQLYKISAGIYLMVVNFPQITHEAQEVTIVYMSIAFSLALSTIYANSLFAYEVRKDIMSKDTHKREKYSCCCV